MNGSDRPLDLGQLVESAARLPRVPGLSFELLLLCPTPDQWHTAHGDSAAVKVCVRDGATSTWELLALDEGSVPAWVSGGGRRIALQDTELHLLAVLAGTRRVAQVLREGRAWWSGSIWTLTVIDGVFGRDRRPG